MAIQPHQQNTEQSPSFLLLDTLYCEEEKWEDEEQEEVCQKIVIYGQNYCTKNGARKNPSLYALSNLAKQDLFWEDGELLSLFTKEEQKVRAFNAKNVEMNSHLSLARREAIEWMFKVNAHYGFSALTSILAINYLDRFLSTFYYQKDNPWTIQLLAVTCLSLAAKVEETQVPLLLDLQVEDAKYVFEAKTIQRAELLVLSALEWKMHPVTPISFLDHIIRRLGLNNHLYWELLRRCESILLILVIDSRSTNYLPSVLAAATMMYVMDQVEPCTSVDYQNQLLEVLKISKEKVKDCYELVVELSKSRSNGHGYSKGNKRKLEPMPGSPSGVIDAVCSSDSLNDSWALGRSSMVSSSPEKPLFKKSRAHDQWVFVDIVGKSPR